MTTHAPNAAMARWHVALQQEASALWRRAAFRGLDLPPDWELSLAEAMRNHYSGFTSSSDFARILRRASALLPEVRS